jgi:MFS family permease
MIPFSIGFVLAGPLSGKLSDHYGARPFATGGMLLNAAMFVLVMAFPANFSYVPFAFVMATMGIAGGLFASPNTSSIMNSVPARDRGAASGMRVTFVNVGLPLSMGLFFTLLVVGLNAKVPSAMYHGLIAHGVPAAQATRLGHVPPLGYLFAAFLGLNPLGSLLGPGVRAHVSAAQWAELTGRRFFPQLVGPGFKHALMYVLAFAITMSVIAAVASAMRGAKYIHEDEESRAQKARMHRGHHLPHHGTKATITVAGNAAGAAGATTLTTAGRGPAAATLPTGQPERRHRQWHRDPSRSPHTVPESPHQP